MHTVLTVSAILIQVLLLTAMYYLAERTRLEVLKLRAARERITEVEAATESLRKQIASLRGKFYASKADDPRPDNYPPTMVPLITSNGPACDNYAIAQDPEHPQWRQARECSCGYCLRARQIRAAEKERTLREHAKSRKPVNGGE